MNELQIFNNDEFGQVRTLIVNDEPWFVGKDVAESLRGDTRCQETLSPVASTMTALI